MEQEQKPVRTEELYEPGAPLPAPGPENLTFDDMEEGEEA